MENSENEVEEKRGGYRENAGRPRKPGVRLSGKISEQSNDQLNALQKRAIALSGNQKYTRVDTLEWAIYELYVREFGIVPE